MSPDKPFLMISSRPEDDALAGERAAILEMTGLAEHDLVQLRIEAAPLGALDPSDFAGIILGGGPYNSSDTDKSELQLRVEADLGALLDEVIDRDQPLLGLCYGIGALTSRLGGGLDRRYGEPVGAVEVTLTEEGRADPLFSGVPTTFRAFVAHKEACSALPEGAVLLATGEACPVQAFRIGAHVYATQFHPELVPAGFAARIRVYRDAGYFAPEETEQLAAFALSAVISPEAQLLLPNFVSLARSLG